MKLLIKIGGTLVDGEAKRHAIALQLKELARTHQVVAVHGGGKQLTKFLEERGIQSRFVRGLRVSDEAVIDALTKVIGGSVNKHLVSAITRTGQAALGISGIDGPLTIAEQLDPELGYVGRPIRTNGQIFDLMLSARYVPVVACIAADERGNIYNVNADQMAVSCAAGWGADRPLFLTDVPGVKAANGEVLPELTPDGIAELVRTGVAHGGMQAKLDAANLALRQGVSEVVIAAGNETDVCIRLLNGERLGTCVVSASPAREVSAE